MLALLRRSIAAFAALALFTPLVRALPAGGEEDNCVHLIGYGGTAPLSSVPTRSSFRQAALGNPMAAGICAVDNARLNRGTPIKTNADFVPVVGDDSLGFYVVYGVRASPTGGIAGNVCIYLIPLDGGEIMLYGSGYGNIPGANLFDAAYDMARVDQVIRFCMGRDPATTPLRILAPHGHGDHINPACNRELERLGYRILEIAFHPGDFPLINGMAWTSADRALFRILPTGRTCLESIANYSSPLGKLWVFERPGHTPGSIDLVLDTLGDATNRMVIRGSLPSSPCAPVPGQREAINAHGNVELISTPPSVGDVTPLQGTSLGGTPLTLTGTDFLASGAGQHRVLVDGRPASNVVVVNDTTLTCATPAGAGGQLVQVAVVNNNGEAFYSGTFFYNALPTVTSLLPTSGDWHGGTTVQVRGSGFLSGGTNDVQFGGKSATALSIKSDTLLTCRAPSGTPGTSVTVSINNSNGQGSLTNAYRYDTGLAITGLAPANGTSLGGTSVVLTGTSFTGSGATPTVTFGGLPATSVVLLSDTSVSCVAPTGVAGATVDVVLTNSAGNATFTGYHYNALPGATSVTPARGRPSGGSLVTLNGSGFTANAAGVNRVRFGGIAATAVTVLSNTALTCLTPPGKANTIVNLTVTNDNGTATLPLAFTYAPPLTVTTLEPATGSADGGTSVTLTGSGFVDGPAGTNAVRFGGVTCTTVSVVDDGILMCVAPPGTPLATVNVDVTNANGTVNVPAAFRYNARPTLATVSPNNGHAGAFTPVTLTGTGFLNDDAGTPFVVAGGIAASQVEVANDTTLLCAIPPGAPGATVDVLLVNQNGTATLAGAFRYHTPPSLSSAAPANGPAAGQLRVTLTGAGFLNDSAGTPTITFGGVAATSVSVSGDQTVRCNAPVGTPGQTVNVVLTNARGTATLVNGYRFNARPRITAVTPNRGTFQGGTAVTLNGAGFTVDAAGPNTVSFGAAAATNVVTVNDTTITCTTPPGVLNAVVDVSVVNANGTGLLAGGFAYSVPPPSVASLAPPSAPAAVPGTVRVNGAGFQSNSPGTNLVKFGGIDASAVTVLSDTALSCQPPAGTPGTSVEVAVTNTNGTGKLANAFRYNALPTLSALAPARGSALGLTTVQLTGTGFQTDAPGTNTVTFGGAPATNVVVVSDTVLTCTAPAGAAGSVQSVRVANANGTTGTQSFTYNPLPTLLTIAPDVGPTIGDTKVTLTGSGFVANAAGAVRVNFDGALAHSVLVLDDATLTCFTPSHATGYVDVVVSDDNGSATLAGVFHYGKVPPALASIDPPNGRAAGSNLVTLHGRGFSTARTTANRVKFGDVFSDNVITVDDSTVLCSAPIGTPGALVDVSINNNNGTGTLAKAYRYNAQPTLASVSPSSGPSLGTGVLTLTGTGFAANAPGTTGVRIGAFVASDVIVLDDTHLTCRVFGTPGKALDVTVFNDNGTATLPGAFSIMGPPRVTQVVPTVGPFTGGTSVTVSGSGFSEGKLAVNFGTTPATGVQVLSDTSLRCVTPPGALGSKVSLRVRSPYGSSTLVGAFTYQAIPPDLTGVTPPNGPASGGTRVNLNGTGFLAQGAGALLVSFGGSAAANVSVLSDTSAACDLPPGSPGAIVDVLVENANGSDGLSGAFQYNEQPTLTALAPPGGPAAGGTLVTLTGRGFLDGAGGNLVLFGGVAANDVLELSDDTLVCTTPPGTPGALVDVSLFNQNGAAFLAAAFRYNAPPVVSAVAPGDGPATGADVTLTGSGFQSAGGGASTVTFGGVAATQVQVTSDTTLTCRAPAGAAGTTVDVSVSNANGTGTRTAAFRYHAEPTLTAVTPNKGPASGGTSVTLRGSGFLNDSPGKTVVFFGNFTATDVLVVNDTTLTCTSPVGSAGNSVDVSVRNANGNAIRPDGFRFNPLPRLLTLTPASGSELGGTAVTITGAGFVINAAGDDAVIFGTTPATNVVVVSDNSLTCVTPPGVAGTNVDVRLNNANGSATLTAAYRYTTAPRLSALAPTDGTALGGTSVTLTGNGFAAAGAGTPSVTFGGSAASAIVVLDDTRVQCTTPAGTGGASQDVVLTNANGSATLAQAFRRHALPSLSAVAPARGSSNASSSVTLTGAGFLADAAGTNTVLFGALPATNVLVLGDTSLSCTVAPQAAGSVVDVRVSNANGSALLAAAFAFDAPAPTLTNVSPASGVSTGGTSVTLTGTGFLVFSAGTNTVAFGGAQASGVVVVNDTTIQCTSPAGTVGAKVDVAVSNTNGSAVRPASFTYLAPAPTLAAVSPANGAATGGGTVTLTGTGFQSNGAGANTVTFGGVAASNVNVLSDTSLTCTVPSGTPGATVAVTVSNANGAPTLPTGYRYNARPAITSVAPADGTSLGGTLVTVRGTGFTIDAAGTNQVLFGSTPGTSLVVFDDTRLTCRAPSGPGGTIVALTLTNANGSVSLPNAFRYHSKPALNSVTPPDGVAGGANRVTLSGSGFLADGASVNIVSFGGVSASGVTVQNDTTIQCNVPAGTAGTSVQVTVANVNGTGLLPNGYRYHARPTLASLAPTHGATTGGTSVTLTGSGFQVDSPGPNAVAFGGVAATAIAVVSDTQLTCLTPGGAPSTSVDVVLTNANGSATLLLAYTYDSAVPILAGTAPTRAPTVGSSPVRLSGSGFQPGMSVSFGATPALNVVVVDDHTIDCLTPALSARGWADVSLAWSQGAASLPLAFEFFTAPALTRLQPSDGDPTGGELVVVEGAGFLESGAGTNEVTIGGVAAVNVVVYDDQHLACEVPPGPVLTDADVVVTNGNGSAALARGFRWQRRLATDLDGDGRGDLVLGSPGDDTLGRDAGAVKVFFSTAMRLVDKSSAQADLAALPDRIATAYGVPVTSGDLDGDGKSELVIAAPGDDLRALNAGTVYVFGGPLAASPAALVPSQARQSLFSLRSSDRFGSSLSVRDIDRDGIGDLLVGVLGRSGAVHVFRGGAGGLAPVANLVILGRFGSENFAASLAAGDLDGDGWVDIVVGAPTAFGPNTGTSWNPGEVRVFRGGPALLNTPDPQPWIVLDGVENGERFGSALAVRDVDGDGIEDLIVGAPASSNTGASSGVVYLFRGGPAFAGGSASTATALVTAESAGDKLGTSLTTGDVDGDGQADLLIGAPAHAGAGRVYLFRGGVALTSRVASAADALLLAEAGSTGEFGNQVAMVDVDGNGLDDMIVTAPGLDSFGTDLGRVYVFGSANLAQNLRAEDAQGKLTGSGAGDQLGRSMSSDH